MLTSGLRYSASVLLLSVTTPSTAVADLLITLDDDGSGNTFGAILGTFDVSGGVPSDRAATAESFRSWFSIADAIEWRHLTTSAPIGQTLSFPAEATNSAILASDFFRVLDTQWTIEDIAIVLNGDDGSAYLAVYDNAHIGQTEVNETFNYEVPFVSFNTGTWDWGTFGGEANDGIRLVIGGGPVPEPTTLTLATLALLPLTRRRRR